MHMDGFDHGVGEEPLQDNEPPELVQCYDDPSRLALIHWAEKVAWPKLEKQFGHIRLGTGDMMWTLVLRDSRTGFEIPLMQVAKAKGQLSIYTEPTKRSLDAITGLLKATRKLSSVSRRTIA